MALNYRLKKGVLLQVFGDASKAVTNDSPHFTDALAEWYLKNQPGCEKYFEVMPGKPSQVTAIQRPPRQPGPTMIIPPEKPVTILEPVEEIKPEEIISAVTEPTKRKTRVVSKSKK